MNKILSVPELDKPTRLDKYLYSILAEYSRASLQQAIRAGQVLVNGKKVAVHHWLRTGDTISLENLNKPSKISLRPNEAVPYELIAEAPDYLVVAKPAGLVIHPAAGVNEPTLIDGLIVKYPELLKVGEDPITRPGIVHRLDREVSGLLVVARNQPMYEHLKKQFAMRSINKEYIGLVIGKMAKPSGTINFPLARSKRNRGKIAARAIASEDTRQAITHYTVVTEYQQATLLRLNLETGRTHQIRAHLGALGHPLVGDTLYRPAKINFKKTPGRIFLHAITLSFTDLNNTKHTFSSPLPPDLQTFLSNLK
jgi:23S rRNA pseudouridine1911/1915/1917 synthase